MPKDGSGAEGSSPPKRRALSGRTGTLPEKRRKNENPRAVRNGQTDRQAGHAQPRADRRTGRALRRNARAEQPGRRREPRAEPRAALRRLCAERVGGYPCPPGAGRGERRGGKLRRPSRHRNPERPLLHGPGHPARGPARHRLRRAQKHDALDAGRHLRLAGGRAGVHRHLLDEYRKLHADVGLPGAGRREQPVLHGDSA